MRCGGNAGAVDCDEGDSAGLKIFLLYRHALRAPATTQPASAPFVTGAASISGRRFQGRAAPRWFV
jgi:hypothetical protein